MEAHHVVRQDRPFGKNDVNCVELTATPELELDVIAHSQGACNTGHGSGWTRSRGGSRHTWKLHSRLPGLLPLAFPGATMGAEGGAGGDVSWTFVLP